MNTKPSVTLRVLEDHEDFTLDEFMAAASPDVGKRTCETNLRNTIKQERDVHPALR